MSTSERQSTFDGKTYKVGTIGWEAPEKWSDLFDVMFDSIVLTYGLWGDFRISKTRHIYLQ